MASARGTFSPHLVFDDDNDPAAVAAANDPPSPNDSVHAGDKSAEAERGRLKRRRMSSHSPPRASSPSRGHDRDSGSRHRQHHRKHHRASSSPSRMTPPSAKKNRRRSDAEPDHTLRGRARNRSESRSRSPILEEERVKWQGRKRSAPPSRHRIDDDDDGGNENVLRRLRSYPNMYRQGSEQVFEDEQGG